jgi:tetratricopeptide (TPR) repeat protein
MSNPEDRGPTLGVLLHQAHALIDRRRFAQARQILAAAALSHPDDPQLLYLTAFIDYSEGKLDDAEKTVQSVLLQNPEHYGGRTLRAELYEARNQYAQAELVWIELLRSYPEDANLYASYAELMMRTLHLDKAQRLMQEGLRLEPDHARCLYVAALLHIIQGRSSDPENEHLQRLVTQYPERIQTLLTLVVALNQRGDNQGALRVAQQLLRLRPDSPQFLNLVKELKFQTHWSLLPLYPMQRWGWAGAGVVTVIGIGVVNISKSQLTSNVATVIGVIWLAYVVYSWVWPQILRRLI